MAGYINKLKSAPVTENCIFDTEVRIKDVKLSHPISLITMPYEIDYAL